MAVSFEWDDKKAQANERKHGVSFREGVTIFDDPFIATMYDPDHSDDENRYLSMGYSSAGRILVVIYTERNNHIRLVSCRKATRFERQKYAQT